MTRKDKKEDKDKDKKGKSKEPKKDADKESSKGGSVGKRPASRDGKQDTLTDLPLPRAPPETVACLLHSRELVLFCMSCEEPVCDGCSTLGPHNNQVAASERSSTEWST